MEKYGMNTNCMTLTRFFLEGQKKHKDATGELTTCNYFIKYEQIIVISL